MSFFARLAQRLQSDQSRSDRQTRLALYNTYDARTLFSELLERVRSGEEIVIGRAGDPIAKLVPYAGEETKPGVFRAHVYVHDRRAGDGAGRPT
ncbi:MAG TPA: type II toxin-antitoxin system prevent-host-death family antitoxin [Gaiellaceae bacterium]|nr:type II toxin-antitoxin system prevent-host-death family antitoxin [Gaiellaceae bacterium]